MMMFLKGGRKKGVFENEVKFYFAGLSDLFIVKKQKRLEKEKIKGVLKTQLKNQLNERDFSFF
jgi:hypothetical protein